MPHLLPLGTTLEGLEKKWGWGGGGRENNSWDCSPVSFRLPATDSMKTMGEEPQNVGAVKMAGGGCRQVTGEKMNVKYSRFKAIRILQSQGARVTRRVLSRKLPESAI